MRRWVVVLLLVTACAQGGRLLESAPEEQAPLPPPTSSLDSADELWVTFESEFVCDLERSSYADLAEVEAALLEKLDDEQLDKADYDAFKARIAADRQLSLHVQAAVVERCG